MMSEKPWKPEAVLFLFGGIFLCIFLGTILSTLLYRHTGDTQPVTVGPLMITLLSFQGSALVLIAFFLRYHRITWREAFGLPNSWKKAVLFGGAGALLFLPVGWLFQWISEVILRHMPYTPTEQEVVQALRVVHSKVEQLSMMAMATVLVPIVEEILFRGILYPLVKQAGFPRAALWGVSLFFAAMHFNLMFFLPLFALAIVLTLLYERTNNLLAPIAAHSLFNAMNLALFYIFKDAA